MGLNLGECKLLEEILEEHLEELNFETHSLDILSDRMEEFKYFKMNNQQSIYEVEMNKKYTELELENIHLNKNKIHKNLLAKEEEQTFLLKLLGIEESFIESHKGGYEYYNSHIKSINDKLHEYLEQVNIESPKIV